MINKRFEINNPENLCDLLLNIFFIVEYTNYYICKSFFNKKYSFSILETLKSLRKEFYNEKFNWFSFRKNNNIPDLLIFLMDLDIFPKTHSLEYVDMAFETIYDSHNIRINQNNRKDLLSSSEIKIFPTTELSALNYKIYWYEKYGKICFYHTKHLATKEMLRGEELVRSRYIFLDEPWDFFNISQYILIKNFFLNEFTSNYYIQRWIRKQFNLKYNFKSKILLTKSSNLYNEMFFGASKISNQKIRTIRASTFSTQALIFQLEDKTDFTEKSDRRLAAVAVFLLFRMCRLLRIRYFCADTDKLRITETGKSESNLRAKLHYGEQCVTALMPSEYNHIEAKSFGLYSCISGLNYIFRGGMLPYVNEGKTCLITGPPGSGKTTFALQRMTEIAFYGGLSIYISLEEPLSVINNRLISFRMSNFNHFDIVEADAKTNLKELLRKNRNTHPFKGLMVIYNFQQAKDDESSISIPKLLHYIEKCADDLGWAYRAAAIDSINSLGFRTSLSNNCSKWEKRLSIRDLIFSIRDSKFLGIIVSEDSDDNFAMLPYISDVHIVFGLSAKGRWIEIKKVRNQNFQAGSHPLRITDGVGLQIYPSLGAVLSSLRSRFKATISQEKLIGFHTFLIKNDAKIEGILEKTFTLICGPAQAGKTKFLFNIITSKRLTRSQQLDTFRNSSNSTSKPGGILLVTFRTSENRYVQRLRVYPDLLAEWEKIPNIVLRWFSPGEDLTGEQILFEIWKIIRASKREGKPIERIVFDEIESAYKMIPRLKENDLFWPTLFELLGTEALTVFFVIGEDSIESNFVPKYSNHMDYIFRIDTIDKGLRNIHVDKWLDSRDLSIHGPIQEPLVMRDDLSQVKD